MDEAPSAKDGLFALAALVAAVGISIIALAVFAYFGGWLAHLVADIAQSGWESK